MNTQNITLADALKEMLHMDEATRRDAFLRPRNSTSSNGQDHSAERAPGTNHNSSAILNGAAVPSNGPDAGDADLDDGEDTVIAPPSAPPAPPEPIAWGVDIRVCVDCVSRVLEYVAQHSSAFQAMMSVMIIYVGPSLTGGGFENEQKVFLIVGNFCPFFEITK